MRIKTLTVLRTIGGNEPFTVTIQQHSLDGKVVNTSDYDSDNFAAHLRLAEYDPEGRLAVLIDKYPREQIETVVKYEFQAGKVIERHYYQDGGNSKNVITHNEENKIISVEKFDDEESPEPFEAERFTYNADGNWVERSVTDSDQNQIEVEVRKYNQDGLVIEAEYRIGENDGRKLFSQYDEKKRLTRRVSEMNGETIQNIVITYEDDGSRTETVENQFINPKFLEQKFNKDNRVIFQELHNFTRGRNQTVKVSKEYNDAGQIIKEVSEDDLDTLNNYTDHYQYEYYAEVVQA